ncbi:MAG: hypothetical protein ABIG68_05030, partial [Acidobacteriota bacterium]
MRYWNRALWAVATLLVPAMAAGQQGSPDRLTVAFSDPSRPGTVKADVMSGAITVRGYEGREVIIVATTRGESGRGKQPAEAEGMRRIQTQGSGLEVVEQNNVIEIETGSFRHAVDLDIQVPRRTSLHLQTINNGEVKVENVHGDHEVEALNGSVTLTGIAGSAVVHALNGRIQAVLTELTPGKSMSFSSMNGDIDVTFPAVLKANAIMQSDNGEI